jgi:hypothetical protein
MQRRGEIDFRIFLSFYRVALSFGFLNQLYHSPSSQSKKKIRQKSPLGGRPKVAQRFIAGA